MTRILLVRHCKANGQEPQASLTPTGYAQAKDLGAFMNRFFKIRRIFSSPFLRAQESVLPLSDLCQVPISTMEELRERDLLGDDHNRYTEEEEDEILNASFEDYHLKHATGESSQEALDRAISFINKIQHDPINDGQFDVVVSHGNLITLILRHLNHAYKDFQISQLSNPDLIVLTFDQHGGCKIDRLWSAEGCLVERERSSARAILLNSRKDAIFLFQIDRNQIANSRNTENCIWITPGGGIDEGETVKMALQRELFEELALTPDEYTVHGLLWKSQKPLIWKGYPHLFVDNYFLVELVSAKVKFNFTNHTAEEKQLLKDFKWFGLDDLERSSEDIVPPQLRSLAAIVHSLPDLPKLEMIQEEI